jgi:hypothetical protein
MIRVINRVSAACLNVLTAMGVAKKDVGIFYPPTMEDFGEGS